MSPPLIEFGHASIALSLLLGILCVGRIRSYDVHEREPYLKLFLVAVYGGLIAAALSLLLYRLASRLGFGAFHSWYGFLLFVGPIEEGAKYLGLRLTRLFYGGRLNEATDGVVYMASVALGFSLIENFMYANAGVGNGHLLWLRLLLATPGHILFSFPMGLSHYLSREEGHPRWTVAACYGLASLNHGIYNILCSAPLGLMLAPAFLLLLWLGLLGVLRYAHATSPFRASFATFLERLPPSLRKGLRCHQCGNEGEMAHFSEGRLEVQRCDECGHYVITRENALRLFHRIAPEFRSLKGEYRDSPGRSGFRALYGVVHVHAKSDVGWFHGESLQAKITEIHSGLRDRLESRTLIRFLFQLSRQGASQSSHPGPSQASRRGASLPPRPGIGDPPHRPDPPPWRDLALAALGMALCVWWGASHLAAPRLVSLHPALSRTWQDSTLSLAYPKGWTLGVWTSDDGRQVSVNLEAEGRAAMVIRGQHWEIVPDVAADRTLQDVMGTLGASELSRRPLARWGRYAGAGAVLDMRSAKGNDLGLSVFAHTGAGRSFVAVEMVQGGFREPLRPGLDLVRRTLRLKRPQVPPRDAPPPSGDAALGPDASVTLRLRAFLARADEDIPAHAAPTGAGRPAAAVP